MLSKNKRLQIEELHSKKGREKQAAFVAEGVKLVQDFESAGQSISELYYTSEVSQWAQSLNVKAVKVEITLSEMKTISALTTPSPVLAILPLLKTSYQLPVVINQLSLLLDGIRDPGNLGTIIRVADWFGIDDVFCSLDTVDCYNPKVVQATMGGLSRVRVHYTDLETLIASAKQEALSKHIHFEVFGTSLTGKSVYAAKLSHCGFLLIGNEGGGLRQGIKAHVTQDLFLPDYPHIHENASKAESLNAAVATGIIVAEFRRRLL